MKKNKRNKLVKVAIATTLGASIFATSIAVPFNVMNNPTIAHAAEVKASQFKDVTPSMASYDAIIELTNRKIIYGYNQNTFKPLETVSRGQFATFLARTLDLPAGDSNFKDLPKTSALYKDISRAAKAGLLVGNGGNVFPNKAVSRADIAVMIDRAMNMKGNYTESVELTFKDKNTIGGYAVESVKRMTKYGIILGKGNNTFAPNEFADRATSAMFIYRMIQVMEKNGEMTPPPVDPQPPVNPPVTPPTNDKDKTDGDHYKVEGEQIQEKYHNVATIHPVIKYTNPIEVKDGEKYKIHFPTNIDMKKSFANLTIKQIEDVIGEYRQVVRLNGKLYEINSVADMVNRAKHVANNPKTFQQLFNSMNDNVWNPYVSYVTTTYPQAEVVSINGVPYRNTGYVYDWASSSFTEDEMFNKAVPVAPTQKGQFKIDFHTYTKDSVTYLKNKAYPTYVATQPTKIGSLGINEDFIVDIKGIFSQTEGIVSVNSDGTELSYNGKTLKLTEGSSQAELNGQPVTLSAKVAAKNGVTHAPLKSIAKALGLDTRTWSDNFNTNNSGVVRLEIANYTLEKDGNFWTENFKIN